jgi:hypothetical protein
MIVHSINSFVHLIAGADFLVPACLWLTPSEKGIPVKLVTLAHGYAKVRHSAMKTVPQRYSQHIASQSSHMTLSDKLHSSLIEFDNVSNIVSCNLSPSH